MHSLADAGNDKSPAHGTASPSGEYASRDHPHLTPDIISHTDDTSPPTYAVCPECNGLAHGECAVEHVDLQKCIAEPARDLGPTTTATQELSPILEGDDLADSTESHVALPAPAEALRRLDAPKSQDGDVHTAPSKLSALAGLPSVRGRFDNPPRRDSDVPSLGASSRTSSPPVRSHGRSRAWENSQVSTTSDRSGSILRHRTSISRENSGDTCDKPGSTKDLSHPFKPSYAKSQARTDDPGTNDINATLHFQTPPVTDPSRNLGNAELPNVLTPPTSAFMSPSPSRTQSPAPPISERAPIGSYPTMDPRESERSVFSCTCPDNVRHDSGLPASHHCPAALARACPVAFRRLGALLPAQSHPSIYHDMSTAVGLTAATPFDSASTIPQPPRAPLPHTNIRCDTCRGRQPRQPSVDASDAGPEEAPFVIPVSWRRPAVGDEELGGRRRHHYIDVFPLKVFRGRDFVILEVDRCWDDEALLIGLKRSYDVLRGWRKYVGLKGVGHLTLVKANHSFIYPQRIGTPWISPHKNMRMCLLLEKPSRAKGRREIVKALTKRPDNGVEFVERWKTRRLLAVIVVCIVISYASMIVYGVRYNDWATGSQIGQFHLSMFSLLFVATAWSQNHDF